MSKTSLWDCSDAYMLLRGNISANNTAAADADANNTNKKSNIWKSWSIY